MERPPRSPLLSSGSRQRLSLSPSKGRRSPIKGRYQVPQRPTRLEVPDASPTSSEPGDVVCPEASRQMPFVSASVPGWYAFQCHTLNLQRLCVLLKAPSIAVRMGRKRYRSGSARSTRPAPLGAGRSAVPSCRSLLLPPKASHPCPQHLPRLPVGAYASPGAVRTGVNEMVV